MNDSFQRLMREATQLTQNGQLADATQAIQRALRNGMPLNAASGQGSDAGRKAGSDSASNPGHKAAASSVVLDGLTRVVERSAKSDAPQAKASRSTTATASAGAPAPGAAQDHSRSAEGERWLDASYTHKGRTLVYKLFVPPHTAHTRSAGRPLVVMLHGCSQDPADFAAGTQMNAVARAHGAVVLYPQQVQGANPQKCWNWFKPQHQERDHGEPAALAALTQAITGEHGIDARRVYVAGLSAGGAMADILGHTHPELFAAVGVHSGLPRGAANDVMSALTAMRSGGEAAPTAGRPVPPTIVFHGDADGTVHVSNGAAIVSAANQHADGPLQAQSQQGKSAHGQAYTRKVYANASGQISAEYWQLHGAGHAWSGGSNAGSYTNPKGVDASAEMMRFFLAHELQRP